MCACIVSPTSVLMFYCFDVGIVELPVERQSLPVVFTELFSCKFPEYLFHVFCALMFRPLELQHSLIATI